MKSFFPEGEGSHPLHFDEDGGYITNAQMQFFLNRQCTGDKITKKFEFLKYMEACKRYNFISDCMEEDSGSALLVWSEHKETFSFVFPADGIVAEHINEFYERGEGEEEEGDSNFGDGIEKKRWS